MADDFDESAGVYDDPTVPDPDSARQKIAGRTSTLQQAKDLNEQLIAFLNAKDYPILKKICEDLEKNTGIKREQAAYGLLGLSILFFLLAGNAAHFVCNLLGFAYPAYASVGAIRSKYTEDDTKWLIYWTVFALFSLLDHWPSQLMDGIQIYWLLKALILLYMAIPETKAAEKIYRHWVDPAILFIEIQLGKEKPVVSVPNSLRHSASPDSYGKRTS